MAKRRLGRGIDALLQGKDVVDESSKDALEREIRDEGEHAVGIIEVSIDRLRPNPDQPRKQFNETALRELAASIESQGVLQPILAEQSEDGDYDIIAGERRYRAARIAGLAQIPVLVRSFSTQEKLEIALIENVHREDLNPIEQAMALKSLQESAGFTQDELAKRLGMNRSSVANSIRLLKLPEELREALSAGTLSAGHARALLSLKDREEQLALYRRVVDEGLSVRQVELLAAGGTLHAGAPGAAGGGTQAPAGDNGSGRAGATGGSAGSGSASGSHGGGAKPVELQQIEQRLIERFGTKVTMKGSNHRGSIEISYLSPDDLERVLELLLDTQYPID